ncbi:TPA: molybdenum cofactor biosynthesis protein MoaE [Candidatus Poribacteria bacterium]|nr:molybdenum cofactor biosynthesis protein MoaE [Candidatus Poribacteria bacterium]
MVRVTDKPITPQIMCEMMSAVQTDQDGALVTFSGVVRGVSNGKRVLRLEYEAYDEMAERELGKIVEEIRGRWGAKAAIIHRTGSLKVGEVSLFIAVSSPHRAEAFHGCRYAIERIKESVPIWKKEVYEDGEEWI